MIKIQSGKNIRWIDEFTFKVKKSKGLLRSWKAVEGSKQGEMITSVPAYRAYNDITTEQVRECLNLKNIPYDKKCEDKRKLYQIYINS